MLYCSEVVAVYVIELEEVQYTVHVYLVPMEFVFFEPHGWCMRKAWGVHMSA